MKDIIYGTFYTFKKEIIELSGMKEEFYYALSICGAIAGYLFGGIDIMLKAFGMLLILDTISGMLRSYWNGTYRSRAFRKEGIPKIISYAIAIIMSVQLDILIGNTGALRAALLFCFIANEATSVVENLGEMGIPFPNKIVKAIAVLRERSEDDETK